MSVLPVEMYAAALRAQTASSPRTDGTQPVWQLRYRDGSVVPLALARWCGELDAADRDLLVRCTGPTLDVGCGPGRLLAALTARGSQALGVDVAELAVRMANLAGGPAVRRSVFESLPDEGGWGAVLLADGNIGIGGDPVRLLTRCRELLAPSGAVHVELDPPGSRTSAVDVRIESAHECSDWFTWAHVAVESVHEPARLAGLRVVESWSRDARHFVVLSR